MADPVNLQPIQSVQPTDDTSSVAGAANVTPSYIPSDIPSVAQPDGSSSIDTVSTSTSVSSGTQPATSAPEDQEGANYIPSTAEEPIMPAASSTIYSMNSLDKVENAYQYITPDDTSVVSLVAQLKSEGVITDGMTDDQIADAIQNYVTANFAYQPEITGDDWQTAAQTIALGGGDCEDLANLEASVLSCALKETGMSDADVAKRVGGVVVANVNTGEGHVVVNYVKDDGTSVYYDPSVKGSLSYSLVDGQDVVLFIYNTQGVNILDTDFNYSTLVTAGVDYTAPETSVIDTAITDLSGSETRLGDIQTDLWSVLDAVNILNSQETVANDIQSYDNDVQTANEDYNHFTNDSYSYGGVIGIGAEHCHPSDCCTINWNNYTYNMNWPYDNGGWFGIGAGGLSPSDKDKITSTVSSYVSDCETRDKALTTLQTDMKNYATLAYTEGYITDKTTLQHDYLDKITSSSTESDIKTLKTQLDNFIDSYTFNLKYYDGKSYTGHTATDTFVSGSPTIESLVTSGSTSNPNPYCLFTKDSDGYYSLNNDSVLFTDYQNEIQNLKARIMVISMIFETLRDLRGLVNQELRGAEEGGYKGMNISKLFMKKVDRIEQSLTKIIGSVLEMMDVMNQTVYLNAEYATNDKFDQQSQDIKDKGDGLDDIFNEQYWNQDEDQLQNEQNRLKELQGEADKYKTAVDANKQAAMNMLNSIGASMGYDLSSVIYGLNNNVVVTNTSNSSYLDTGGLDANGNSVLDDLESSIEGMVAGRRIENAAMGTMAQMRNLVHEEMTGISGRQMNTDAIGDMIETEGNSVLTWFEQSVSLIKLDVQLYNQKEYDQINIDKLQKEIDQMNNWFNKFLGWVGKGIGLVADLVGVICCFIPGVGIAIGAAVAAIGNAIGGLLTSIDNLWNSTAFYAIDQQFNDVYHPNPPTAPTNPSTGDTTDNPLLAALLTNENGIYTDLAGMTPDNYLTSDNNGHNAANNPGWMPSSWFGGDWAGDMRSFAGTYSFDSKAFDATQQKITGMEIAMMVLESIRDEMIQARNLVHMEMTSIGGREPSSMVTYTMEAARGQMSFLMSMAKSYIQAEGQARNLEYERNMELLQALQNINNAFTSLVLNYIPVFGPMLSNQADLNTQLRNYQEQAQATFTSKSDFTYEEDVLNQLFNSGISTDGDRWAVDYSAVMGAANELEKIFVAKAVLAAIRKASQDMRSVVHMEMTGIKGIEGSTLVSEVNSVEFSAAMQSLDNITEYLQERVKVHNEALDASKQVTQLQDEMNTGWQGMIVAAVVMVASFVVGALVGAALETAANIAVSFGDFVASVYDAMNSWSHYTFLQGQASQNTDKLESILKDLKAVEDSTDTSGSRMEQLTQAAIDEIVADLMQNAGYGTIGVNRGLASGYKALLDKIFRAEKTMNEIKNTLIELRNLVDAAMRGMSGIVTDATGQALSMQLQAEKAKIDQAFNALQAVADRRNELTQAEREAERAYVEAMLARVTAIISGVSTVVNVAESVAQDVASDPSKSDAARKEAGNYFNSLKSAADVIKVLSMGANLLESFWKAEQLTAKEYEINARNVQVNGKTVSRTPATSNVMTQGVAGAITGSEARAMSIDDYIAMWEDRSGQAQIDHQAKENQYNVKKINNELNQQLNQQAVSDVNETLGMLKEIFPEKEPLNVPTAGETPETPQTTAVPKDVEGTPAANNLKAVPKDTNAGKPASDFKKDLENALKQVQDALKAISPQAGQMAIMSLIGNGIQMLLNIGKQERTQQNTSNALAYYDQLIAKAETAAGVKDVNPAQPGAPAQSAQTAQNPEKPTPEQLRQMLRETKDQLIATQKKLGEAIKSLDDAKAKLPAAQAQVVSAQEDLLKAEKSKIDNIIDIENRLGELDKLIGGQKDDKVKQVLAKQKDKIAKQLDALTKDFEDFDKLNVVAAEVNANERQQLVKEAESDISSIKNQIEDLKQRVKVLSSALVNEEKEVKKLKEAPKGVNHYVSEMPTK